MRLISPLTGPIKPMTQRMKFEIISGRFTYKTARNVKQAINISIIKRFIVAFRLFE